MDKTEPIPVPQVSAAAPVRRRGQRFGFVGLLQASLSALAVAQTLSIENSTIATSPSGWHFAQSRAALVPSNPPRVIVTTQQIVESAGTHSYRDLLSLQSVDGGQTWSEPSVIESLRRRPTTAGSELVIGDPCSQWHAATHKLLVTGKTFGFRDGKEDRTQERVAYTTFDPVNGQWSDLKILALPEKDHAGHNILEPNSGCCQRLDLPNGEVLLPIRYRADPQSAAYTTIVARCTFDGSTLAYREHGSELSIDRDRGLYEPSLAFFGGKFFLTMRADHSAFVARSDDGLHFEPICEWTFDDGTILGSYNAQQHWIVHNDGLFLAYSRRGANNDNVFRNRAPLFVARVDPQRLCVLRGTEQVLMPNNGLDLAGGFGVLDVSPTEAWVTSSELNYPKSRAAEPNHVLLAKIHWDRPGANLPLTSSPTTQP